ncbi:ribosomal L1 domain-containing protein CG13096-like [Pollicipes pollicipes]|uniref:ribosomal L1 domain-containing protein CG13096-like n=1 Tax=Pollicipes pollicipes TaxID=41117 RepID=UPI00188597E4|nr:ribosomal L1 domain-containing protein CG13096-like [Pollicipes pollicipes]
MDAKNLADEIDNALNSTYLHLYNSGDSSAVQVGRCGQTEEQLFQNVMAAVETLKQKFPGGLKNVRCLHLKLDKSVALPIFVSTVSANAVPVPAARRQPGSGRSPVVGELSTVRAQSDVIVNRFGDVEVVQRRPLSDDEELTDEEEENSAGRRSRKRAKKQPPPAKKSPAPAEAVAPAAEPDSSDEEDLELAARERQFLDQLASEKAGAAPGPAALQGEAGGRPGGGQKSRAGHAKKASGVMAKQGQVTTDARRGLREKGARAQKTGPVTARAQRGGHAKKGKSLTPVKNEKVSPAKMYSKKKIKGIGKMKKVK